VDAAHGEADGRDGGRAAVGSLDQHLGRVRARVRTAVPLTDEERRALSAKIGQALRSRQVLGGS
jgi:F0F1-type ATP synthase delta subunit